jgi:hypothetical protein
MKGKEKYIRLFSIFEYELIKYNKVFEKEDYVLSYIIGKTILSKDYDIAVTLSIKKNPLLAKYYDEPRNIKTLLQSYCNYFSISDVKIVRPFKRFQPNVSPHTISPPLEDRIFFEFFKHQSSLDFLD